MNMWTKYYVAIGLLLLITLVSCSTLPLENEQAEPNPNWVVVTSKQAGEIASWLGGSGGFWTPTADDIFKLEEGLVEYLSQNSSYFYREPPVWERLDEYQRQYIGLERGSSKIIYGNFFCNNMGIDWRNNIVMVEDGGDCYFQIEYDVEDGNFVMLIVNGES